MQDDCVPVEGFLTAADRVRDVLPEAMICFCVQGMLAHSRTAYDNALRYGPNLVQLRGLMWVPALAVGWTPTLASCASTWEQTQRRSPRWKGDDAVLVAFANYCRVEVWATAPSIVDHPDDTVSLIGKRAYGRPNRRPIALHDGNAEDLVFAAS